MSPYAPLAELPSLVIGAMADVWALPAPVDVLCVLLLAVLWVPVVVIVRATTNVAWLGVWWPPVYWLVVVWLVGLGQRGAAVDQKVFAGGEDVSAFAPSGRASWLGFAARATRVRVRVRASVAATQMIVGWGGASVLLVVGVVGVWLLPLGAGWLCWIRPRRTWQQRYGSETIEA